MKYDVAFETRGGRCAWCWQSLGQLDSHSVLRTVSAPPLELRFHHDCFQEYRNLSRAELSNRGAYQNWNPQMIESMRLSLGIPRPSFAKQLGLSVETYYRLLAGEERVFSESVVKLAKSIAARNNWNIKSFIDWSDDRAFFCLRMHLNLSANDLSRKLKSPSRASCIKWDNEGIPRGSLRTWARLDRIAKEAGFDAGMLVHDRLWTIEFLQATYRQSGRSIREWAIASELSQEALRNWLRGKASIQRSSAWRLTRGATRLGVELPPIGRVPKHAGKRTVNPLRGELAGRH